MLKTKYKIPNTNTEIDVDITVKSMVMNMDDRIDINLEITDSSLGEGAEPITQIKETFRKGTTEFDNFVQAIIATIDDTAETKLKQKPEYANAIKEPRVFIPTHKPENPGQPE